MPLLDYDGFVSIYNAGGGVPDPIARTVDLVQAAIDEHAPVRAVEVGAGNCLLAAEIAKTIPVVAVDINNVARAFGDYEYRHLDATTDDLFGLLDAGTMLYARRTMCLLFDPEWIQRVNATGCRLIVSEALDREPHPRFPNGHTEAAFLRFHGWDVTVDGTGVVASRSVDSASQ